MTETNMTASDQVIDQTPKVVTAVQLVSKQDFLILFSKQIPYFAQAENLNFKTTAVKPADSDHVKNARFYLTEVLKEYQNLPCRQLSNIISLHDIVHTHTQNELIKPCMVTFLSQVPVSQMYEELELLCSKKEIKGVADGPLTASFVRAKEFETGKHSEDVILVPIKYQKIKSPAKIFFLEVSLTRSVHRTEVRWRFRERDTVEAGESILAFL